MYRVIVIALVSCLVACSCSRNIVVENQIEASPMIFPDYKDVVVPVNIAPLNFDIMEQSEGRVYLKIECGSKERFVPAGKGKVRFGMKSWRSMMEEACGDKVIMTVCVRKDGKWTSFKPFDIKVVADEIDPYLAYRLIPPGYTMWKEMSICQRNLETYKESRIYSNLQGRGNCVNCHSFRDRDPQDMLFHLRSELGGTYIFRNGVKERLDTKTDHTISALVYPFWHTSGDYVAFTVNITNEVVHTRNRNVVEVVDEASDVVVYDVNNHEIITADILSDNESFETFPHRRRYRRCAHCPRPRYGRLHCRHGLWSARAFPGG